MSLRPEVDVDRGQRIAHNAKSDRIVVTQRRVLPLVALRRNALVAD